MMFINDNNILLLSNILDTYICTQSYFV